MYDPQEREDYKPAPDKPDGPHHTVSEAANPDLNGDMTFRYPTAFDEIRIGARMADLVTGGLPSSLTIDQLPFRAKLYAQAVATLEFCILHAPKGWYRENERTGRPVLAPGAVGEGDEEVVADTFLAFNKWRERFRGALKKSRQPQGPAAVVPGGETYGDDESRGH